MPLALTTPLNCGASDATENVTQYAQVKIIKQEIDIENRRITIKVQYGNTIEGAWVPAMPIGQVNRPSQYLIYNIPESEDENGDPVPADPEYNTIVAAAVSTAADQRAYDITASYLYQWLIDKGYFAGTVV